MCRRRVLEARSLLGATRGGARTDDRGMYELANLSPGEYRLSVHAQPWYTVGRQNLLPE